MPAWSPVAVPAAPRNGGVGSLPGEEIGASVTTGAPVSITNVEATLSPRLPAASLWTAWAVYVPSGSEPVVNDHSPPEAANTPVETSVPPTEPPAYTVTETSALSPGAVPACPSRVGVRSLPGVCTD